MQRFRKRILPKTWVSAIAIGALFLGFAGATVRASNNQDSQQSDGFFGFTRAIAQYLFGASAAVDTVQFSTATITVQEVGNPPGFVQITVNRTGDLSTQGSVDFIVQDGGAGPGFATGGPSCTGGFDYVNTGGTLVFNPNIASQTFVVPICDDAVIENNETFNVILTNPQGVLVGTPGTLQVTIVDNDAAGPGQFQFSGTAFSGTEDGGVALLTVTRINGSTGAATVSYTLANGSATGGPSCGVAGIDFDNDPGTITFANGQTSATISVPLCNDGIPEGNETFTATLTSTTAGTLGAPTTATVTIIDADPNTPGSFSFLAASTSAREYTGTVRVTIRRTGGTSGVVSVGYQINNGTAVGGTTCAPGVDFLLPDGSATGTRTFLSGQQSTNQFIDIQLCEDRDDEFDETFSVTLQNPVGGANIIAPSTATVTIQDDDNGVFQFDPTAISVNEGNTTVTITVSRVNVDPATVNTIGRTQVSYSTGGGTATGGGGPACGQAGVDYISQTGTLIFDPGVTSQSFSIQVCDDAIFENPNETFGLTLFAPQTINAGPLGNPLLGPNSTATVTIVDNDVAQPGQFNVTVTPNPVPEGTTAGGNNTVTITVNRTGGSDTDVSVRVTTAPGTATGGASCATGIDYINRNTVLNFDEGELQETTTVTICNDTVFEPSETFTVSLSEPTGETGFPAPTIGVGTATVTIIDNDAQAGTIQFDPTTYQVIESAAAAQVRVVRTAGFDVAVSATVSFGGGTAIGGASCNTAGVDYINTAQTVNFPALTSNPGPGGQVVTVNVPICQDTDVEGNETFTATLSNPTGGVTIGANSTATVTILDDESGTLQFSAANYTVDEGAGTITVTVTRLANQSGSNGVVSVDFILSDGTATGGTVCGGTVDYVNPAGSPDGTLTFGTSVTTQTFNIPICDDLLDEPNETINLTLTNATGGNVVIGPQNTATVTITDNDATPTVAITNVTQPEGNTGTTNFVFNVTLSAASGQQATVNFTTANGTATGGTACGGAVDYVTQSGTLTFAAGTTTQTVTVPVCGDLNFEPNETFFVNLSGATNSTIPTGTQGVGTITNDDGAPGTLQVTNLASNAARINEGDNGTQTLTFTLTNQNPNGLPASVQFSTSGGTATGGASCATAGVDYVTQTGTVNFAANSSTTTPITIVVCNDNLREPNETIFITFSNPNNINIPTGAQAVAIIIDDDRAIQADFDLDRITDFSVFRPSTGFWYVLQSINGQFRAEQFGASTDLPVPGDYDGDGATDFAFFRPGAQATFNVIRSSDAQTQAAQFGTTGDIPVQGDYNGDGRTDYAIFRPSAGLWVIARPTGVPSQNFDAIQFGQSGDIPVQGDYDGDGRTDIAVYRNGNWFVRRSSDNSFQAFQFGTATDEPLVGDYDGDGRTDFAVFRPSAGAFYIQQSLTNTFRAEVFGLSTDIPTTGDYDGDGTTDISVWRPSNGFFYLLRSSDNAFRAQQFGTSGDYPIPSRYQSSLVP